MTNLKEKKIQYLSENINKLLIVKKKCIIANYKAFLSVMSAFARTLLSPLKKYEDLMKSSTKDGARLSYLVSSRPKSNQVGPSAI